MYSNVSIKPGGFSSSEEDEFDEFYMDYVPRNKTKYKIQAPVKDYKTQVQDSIMYDSTEEFINLLKNNNNKINFDFDGQTPLMIAASYGQYEKMEYLLHLGADVNYNYNLFTPLFAVCSSHKPEKDLLKCMEILQRYNAEFDIKDRFDMTPLMYACKSGHNELVKFLIKKCPNTLNKTDSEDTSALFHAVINNQPAIVQTLLAANADQNSQDFQGRTVLDIAKLKRYDDIIELLSPGFLEQEELEKADEEFKRHMPCGTHDYITLLKSNLPDTRDVQRTGFYTNVIDMLNACEMLDFCNNEVVEKRLSLFDFININKQTLQDDYNICLNYQRNEILTSIKLFNLCPWKLTRSVVKKTSKQQVTLDELIYYMYVICEQIYVDYATLHYIENNGFPLQRFKDEKIDLAKTLIKISLILSKYERYAEKVLLRNNCLHAAGLIEESDNLIMWMKRFMYVSVPVLVGIGSWLVMQI